MSGLIGGATADRLRPIALKTCKDVIGYEEGSIVAAATQCIGTVNWAAFSRWSSSQYCIMRNSDEMTVGETHPTVSAKIIEL